MPPESAVKTGIRDEMDPVELAQLARGRVDEVGHGSWTREALLLGELIDLNRRLIHIATRALGGKGSEPDQYPRPGVLTPQQRARLIRPESVDRVLELEAARQAHAERRAAAGL